jgi:hypothetical protein
MGNAAKRRTALMLGQPWPEDLHVCPRCDFRDTVLKGPHTTPLSAIPTMMAGCPKCLAIWEAFPDGWEHDAVAGQPCDNCAFAINSPEIQDREGWKALLKSLKAGNEFRCHKGCPIVVVTEASGAETIGFDLPHMERKARTCVGFLRAMRKWPNWLKNRYPDLDWPADAS